MKTTFQEIKKQVRLLPSIADGPPLLGDGLWGRLFLPEERGWFWACRSLIEGAISPACEPDSCALLNCLPPCDRMLANLVLSCAEARLQVGPEASFDDGFYELLARQACVPPGFARDVMRELDTPEEKVERRGGILSGLLRPARRTQTVTVLLIDQRGRGSGVVADLRLEMVPGGTGRIYPVPALAFVRRDPGFNGAAEIALQRVKESGQWPTDCDMRWSLVRRDRAPLNSLLVGNSLGAAFAVGLEAILGHGDQSTGFSDAVLSGVAVAATISPDGTLGPVGEEVAKLLAAAREGTLPRVYAVIMARDQPLDVTGLEEQPPGSGVFSDPREEFCVLRAATLKEAAEMVRLNLQERWHGIDCHLPPADPDFTGREALFGHVAGFVERNESGYLVIMGEMGIGKSAFMTALLHRERANAPVFHLISSHRAGLPEQIAGCFYDRLRRKHRISEPSEWARFSIEQKLERLMADLSPRLQATNRKELLYLEAADQAQLTAGKCLIPGCLGRLPPRFFCIVTSRFQLNWIHHPAQTEICDLSEIVDAQTDVWAYLRKKGGQLTPPLPEDFIERVATQTPTPVFFTVVSCMQRLLNPATPAGVRAQLRSEPALWAMPPKDLIAQELEIQLERSRTLGITDRDFWFSLAVLTVTGDDYLGPAQLEPLGVLNSARRVVLENCASFFQRCPAAHNPTRPYVFAHPGYFREIQERAGPELLRECHEALAQGCLNVLANGNRPARGYALRHLLGHLRHGELLDQLCNTLTDLEFLQRALGAAGPDPLAPAEAHPEMPALTPFRLAYEFRRACEVVPESHPRHLELKALKGVIERDPHSLHEDPSLLPQQLYNDLAWKFGPGTQLGKRVRDLALRQQRPWIRSPGPPPNRRAQEPVRVLAGHQGGVLAIALSQHGLLVSGGGDARVRLWRADTGESIGLTAHQGPVRAVAFAPDGRHFVSGGSDGALVVWDARALHRPAFRQPVRKIYPEAGDILTLAFTHDGSRLISAGADGCLYLWDTSTWKLAHRLEKHGATVRALAVSPNNELIASGGEDTTIRIWSLTKPGYLQRIRDNERWVEAVAFLQDSKTIVSGGGYRCGDVRFWNLEGQCIRVWPEGHTEGVKAIAVSRDGLKLASGSYDGRVLVRNVLTGACYLPMGHPDRIEAMTFSQDGKTFATACNDHRIRIWDVGGEPTVPSPEEEAPLKNPDPLLRGIVFLDNSQLAATCGKSPVLKLVETGTGKVRNVLDGPPERDLSCVAAARSRPLVAGGSYQQVRVWDLNSATALRTFSGLRGWVVACAFSPDSKTLAAAGEDDKVMVWETDTGAWLRTFPCPQTRTRCLGFTPDGSTLVAGGEDGKLRMWDLSQRDQPAAETFDLHQGPILSLAFAPDRQMLATGGEDECIRMLNYGLKSPLSALRLHHGAVSTLAFSSDSRWLASGSKDGVRIWDTQSMSLLAWLPCHDRVLAVGFVQSNSGLLVAADGGASHHPEFLRLELANFIPAAKPLDYDI